MRNKYPGARMKKLFSILFFIIDNANADSLVDVRNTIDNGLERSLKYVARPILNSEQTVFLKGQLGGIKPDSQIDSLEYETVDLRRWDSPVRNQGAEGLCTAFAVVAAEEFHAKKQGLVINLSERHLWYSYQEYYTVKALAAAKRWWITTESVWPYAKARPVSEVTPNGHLKNYTEVRSFKDLKAALRMGLPVVLSTETNSSWNNPYKGVLTASGDVEGGHAILVSGFFMTSRGIYYIIKNSWGLYYGDRGYVYMPENYCMNYWCSFHVVTGAEFL